MSSGSLGHCAWVTLATTDGYAVGALVLAHSLRNIKTQHKLHVLYTSGVSSNLRNQLKEVYDDSTEVNVLDSGDEENLALIGRPDLGVTFTKLHCWRLVQYGKCVFLDADTFVLLCFSLFIKIILKRLLKIVMSFLSILSFLLRQILDGLTFLTLVYLFMFHRWRHITVFYNLL
jgi:lipopolysaccharide biosynthesis glycosyltransferase